MKKTMLFILTILILLLSVGAASGNSLTQTSAAEITEYIKDETVYVSLDASGFALGVSAVSRITANGSGIYVDSGLYESVSILGGADKVWTEGDKIYLEATAEAPAIYYQGNIIDALLPYAFRIEYIMDGKMISAEDAAGKSGAFSIRIAVDPSENAPAYFRDNYLCNISAAIDLDKVAELSSEGASAIVTGRTMTLNFTVFPGEEAVFEISFNTASFSFSGFEIACMPFGSALPSGLDAAELTEGIGALSQGAGQIRLGLEDLEDGLISVSEGVSSISGSQTALKAGLDKTGNGQKALSAGLCRLYDEAEVITHKLEEMAAGSIGLRDLFLQIEASVTPLVSAMEDKEQAAGLTAMISAYSSSITAFAEGLSQISKGMSAFTKALQTLDESSASLSTGLQGIISGMAALTDGLAASAAGLENFPPAVAELAAAQGKLESNIREAGKALSVLPSPADGTPVSFISPESKNTRSVQFIYKSKAVTLPIEQKTAPEREEKSKSFFGRLADLFRK